MKKGIVNIKGKDYVTVARRVELAHQEKSLESVVTEVLSHNPVVVKARVKIKGQEFTGISSVDLDSGKVIERENPYEVAETSAVGRALGFAGYGVIESIASADEMVRATSPKSALDTVNAGARPVQTKLTGVTCNKCGEPAIAAKGYHKGWEKLPRYLLLNR